MGTPGGRRGFDACWLDADGRIGMVNWAQQREEGVFFHTGGGVQQRRQEGAGLCTPPHSSRVIYLIVFFPPAHSPAGAATAQKGWRSVKPQNLASSQGSSTFDKVTQHINYLSSSRYRHAFVMFCVYVQ